MEERRGENTGGRERSETVCSEAPAALVRPTACGQSLTASPAEPALKTNAPPSPPPPHQEDLEPLHAPLQAAPKHGDVVVVPAALRGQMKRRDGRRQAAARALPTGRTPRARATSPAQQRSDSHLGRHLLGAQRLVGQRLDAVKVEPLVQGVELAAGGLDDLLRCWRQGLGLGELDEGAAGGEDSCKLKSVGAASPTALSSDRPPAPPTPSSSSTQPSPPGPPRPQTSRPSG